ncbi:uncharacterized protein LOC111259721 isoform X2 [Varroa jacobsoni]|uniref:PH domain-containing protein n=1 Tax=Varroa destructor TaxID=109461 RepID=A0A7M7K220_VARDE|nr:uncharacterized protein LOC111250113 isoform X2 [Varroa destructor]XP_022687653.1 uncharacterized protein LOC111259721 isoform X2 [Varroa jacobsoni]
MERALSVHLLHELINLMKTYILRLEVFERTFHYSGEKMALSIMKNLTAIRLANEQGLAKLQTGLAKEDRTQCEEFTFLLSVWKTERMKILYSVALQHMQEGSTLCLGWKNRPDVLQTMAQHNVNIMGKENKAHISIFTYPGLIKDHLFNLKSILNECLKESVRRKRKSTKIIETVIRRLDSLIVWLENSLTLLPTMKNMNASIVPEREHRAAAPEPLLRKGVFSLLVHNNLDAEEAHIFLGSKHILFRLTYNSFFKNDKWEFGRIEKLDVEEGDDDYTFNLSGVGLRKILIAKTVEIRDDWMEAIMDLQDLQSSTKAEQE